MRAVLERDKTLLTNTHEVGRAVRRVIPEPTHTSDVRRNNLELVLRHLAVLGPASRAEIASRAGLPQPTVSRLVGQLLDLSLVREIGVDRRKGSGRPRTKLDLDGRHILSIGLELNFDALTVFVTDLAGQERLHARRPLNVRKLSPEEATHQLAALCQDAVSQLSTADTAVPKVRGLGVAVPGSVDLDTDTLINAPNLGWQPFPIGSAIAAELGWPGLTVIVENDANFAALAEYWTGPHAGTEDFVYVTGDGIGGGLVVGGRLLLSAGGRAGAVGHMTIDPSGPVCVCGRVGCWEGIIGLPAFLRTVGLPPVGRRGPEASLRAVVKRARAGDTPMLEALATLGYWVGLGAANIVNLLGSEVVILGGYFAELDQWVLPTARRTLSEHVVVPKRDQLMVSSTLGFNAAAIGAGLQAANQVLANPVLLRDMPVRRS
jgi:predicted NBD/HSP70 family sugar kinase